MGILKVGVDAVSTVLADQWREYFYCSSLDVNTLVKKGEKKNARGNNNGSDNIISNGSIIAVNEGQCMIIVEQGAIVEFCAEPGEFVFDTSSEPSIFTGNLLGNIKESFKTFGRRVSMGGETGKDQRVYYFNTKEILGNKYGTANPIPFRVVDRNVGLDIDISVRCHGEYAYRITDPILFYKNICGNVESTYNRTSIDSQLKSDMLTALQPAFAKLSELGIRYSAVPGHTLELADALNEVLSQKWGQRLGISIANIGISSINASEEDENLIKELQRNAAFKDPTMAAAHMVGSSAAAMQAAAANESTGPMMAFAGVNMMNQAGAYQAQNLFAMGQQQQAAQAQAAPAQAPQAAPAQAGWTCSCGATGNTGKFCAECGAPKPAPAASDVWTCSCGAQNKGKFCAECGAPKPAAAPKYKCSTCGWEPEDPFNPPKFCPECGNIFDENDIVK